METRIETRTYISEQDTSILHFRLEKFRTYAEAKKYLNDFVGEQLRKINGEGYDEGEDMKPVKVIYKNSNNPAEVKQCIYDMLLELSDRSDILNRELERCHEEGNTSLKDVHSRKLTEYLHGVIKKNSHIREWIIKWKEEPAFNIDEWNVRLRPKEGVENYIKEMRQNLIDIGLFDYDASEVTWNFVCGISDEEPKHLIKFNGDNLHFAVLLGNFFAPQNSKRPYFNYRDGEAAQRFVCTFFLNRNGKPMNYNSVLSEKSRSDKRDTERYSYDKRHKKRSDEIWNKMKLKGMI